MSWHQHISKKLGQGHVYHCVASPLLFITVCKRLGTEETSCSSLGIGMLSHSCLIQASSCSTVLGLPCHIFLFMMRQMFSMGERSGLQAGHFSTRILLLRSHDVVIDAVCGLALLCWKMQGLPWKRRRLDGSICCSRTWIYLSALMVPFQMCKLPMPHALMHSTPYHQRCRLLNWALITTWVVLVLFSPDDMASQFSKKNFKFWFVWPQNSFPLCHSPF